MKVGVYFDLRNPPQWRQDPSRLYGFTIEACQEAERLGASSVWFSEHHLFDDDYLAQPLTFAAAVAARTSRVRLGTAIVIAPLHHPAELAEQCAAVDLISGGRLDLGIGTGYRVPEFELFDASIEARYAQTDGTARRLRELWGKDGVRPGPVQDPMPIWMGYQGPQGARRAGLLGEGLLSVDASLWEPYRDGLAEAGHPVERGVMSGGIQGWATDDPELDWPVVSKHLEYQLNSYRRHMVEGTGRPPPRPVDLDRIVNAGSMAPLKDFAYGTPEHLAETIKSGTAGAPVDTVFLWASIGGMSEDVTMRNIETICTRLAPLLADA
ncbi:LLM class flavin-dependent oxidoreductase [Mycolicibacterium flavescens]|uniref:Monooxygenase n=1 Tax=Mycolicibacterium flavescens TaxID=1776 RepID=A0A1E3RDH6_MYCFV|nr:LLM class flavin-dependent oxidoreductase [Mycolicibacterium flavescens]MCV7282379.1 LLM class flavin-dependent oxidoreductase [Mycolicibacterium flavescens]ODQ87904.1 monooxygenase [Mycolicibacterium flavescens]